VLDHAVYRLWNVFHDDVEVKLIRLISSRVECVSQVDDVRVLTHVLHNLQLSVLVPPILKHLLNRNGLARLCDSCLVDDTERAIINYSISIVCEIPTLLLPVFARVSFVLREFTCTAAAGAV
jgi:hypothetical protein